MVTTSHIQFTDRQAAPLGDGGTPGIHRCATVPHCATARKSGDSGAEFAVSSFELDGMNYVDILSYGDNKGGEQHQFRKTGRVQHYFPASCLSFAPSSAPNGGRDLLLTGSDHLRVWNLRRNHLVGLLAHRHSNSSDSCAPVTGMEWSSVDPTLAVSCDLHGFLYHWDMNTCLMKGQPVQFEGPLYDAKLNNTPDVLGVLSSTDLLLMDMRSGNREVHQTPLRSGMFAAEQSQSPGKMCWHQSGNTIAITWYEGGLTQYDMRNLQTSIVRTVAQEVPLSDMVFHPSNPDYILASTERGHLQAWQCGDDSAPSPKMSGRAQPVYSAKLGGSAILAPVQGTNLVGVGTSAGGSDPRFSVSTVPQQFEEQDVQNVNIRNN